MKNSKAIKILHEQITKLRDDNVAQSSIWKNETKRYIADFFGENSSEYDYFKYSGSWWVLHPSISNTPQKTVEQQKEEIIGFLESCIDIIRNIGIVRTSKHNFLYTLKTEYVVLLFSAVAGVAFASGNVIGIYTEKSETNKLNTKVSSLEMQLNSCKVSKSEKTIKNSL